MPQLFANNASAKLLNSITASSTTVTLQAGQGAKFRVAVWPNYMKVTMEDPAKNTEVIRVTRASGSDSLQVVDENGNVSANGRALEGTSARAFTAGDLCELRLTADALNEFSAKVDRDGDTMTGPLSLPGDPSAPDHAARKAYVDSEVTDARSYAAGLGTAKISVNDTTPGLLIAKLLAGAGISVTVENAGGNETLRIAATGSFVPAGAIVDFPCATAPAGYLPCDGRLVSRTTYAALWAFAASSGNLTASDASWSSNQQYGSFSPGDGSTTFRIPDLRGLYRRGNDGGRGLSTMTSLGKYYTDDNKSHAHTGSTASAGAHTHDITRHASTGGTATRLQIWASSASASTLAGAALSAGAHSHVLTINASGSAEVKVKTATVLTCIKT